MEYFVIPLFIIYAYVSTRLTLKYYSFLKHKNKFLKIKIIYWEILGIVTYLISFHYSLLGMKWFIHYFRV